MSFLDRISALQDKLRHEVEEAKGYAEYEATDDEEEGEEEQEKHEDTLPASSTNAP
jgi:hypothetical protein